MSRFPDLGGYPDRGHGSPPGLTLHDLGEVVRRVGRRGGFEVQSEYKCYRTGKSAIDWVWLDGRRVVAAFELEGRDTDSKTFKKDVAKLTSPRLMAHGCQVRAVVFFQVNHNLNPKSAVARPKERVARWVRQGQGIDVLLDVELLTKAGQRDLLGRTRGTR